MDPTQIVIGTRTDGHIFTQGLLGPKTLADSTGVSAGHAGAGIAALSGGNAVVAGGSNLTIDVPTSTFVAELTETADPRLPLPVREAPSLGRPSRPSGEKCSA